MLRALSAGGARVVVEGEVLGAEVVVQLAVHGCTQSLHVVPDVACELTLEEIAAAIAGGSGL